jgi:hypothetical protein
MKYISQKTSHTLTGLFSILLGVITFFPNVSFAQSSATQCAASFTTLSDFFTYGTCLLSKTIVPLIVTVALVMFLFGVMKFILNSGDETKRKEGREFMLWGIISLFVMLSIWGILNLLTNTFGLTVFAIPQLQ